MQNIIDSYLNNNLTLMQQLNASPEFKKSLEGAAQICLTALQNGQKIILVGNGGSAADAQHIAAELVGRFADERPALAALALTTDTSALTAIANDYGYDHVFSRQIEALGQKGDVLIAISTSGASANIIQALKAAKTRKLFAIGLCGKNSEQMATFCDVTISIPSDQTPHVQEAHAVVGHLLCHLIEQNLSQ